MDKLQSVIGTLTGNKNWDGKSRVASHRLQSEKKFKEKETVLTWRKDLKITHIFVNLEKNRGITKLRNGGKCLRQICFRCKLSTFCSVSKAFVCFLSFRLEKEKNIFSQATILQFYKTLS